MSNVTTVIIVADAGEQEAWRFLNRLIQQSGRLFEFRPMPREAATGNKVLEFDKRK